MHLSAIWYGLGAYCIKLKQVYATIFATTFTLLAGSSALLSMPSCCAGAAGNPVSVLFAGKSVEALQDPAVAQLSRWGYPVPSCVEALQRLKGSPDAAHQDLFARLSGQSSF